MTLSVYFEDRIPLKPALGGVCSLANYSVAYEETQSNQVSEFRDFVCSLFHKAILFDFLFICGVCFCHYLFIISPSFVATGNRWFVIVVFPLSLFVPYLTFLCCLGKPVLCDCGISVVIVCSLSHLPLLPREARAL